MDATKPKELIKDDDEGNQSYAFGYFIFDLRPNAPEILTFRSNIFPNETQPITLYHNDEA